MLGLSCLLGERQDGFNLSRYSTGLKICKSLFAAVHESTFGHEADVAIAFGDVRFGVKRTSCGRSPMPAYEVFQD
jgi:hypothetical protein